MTDMHGGRPAGHLAPHRGPVVLVLGILSVMMLPPLGPFAWVMGRNDLRAMDDGRMDPTGRGLAQAGMITGIIGTAFLAIWVLVLIVALAIPAIAMATR